MAGFVDVDRDGHLLLSVHVQPSARRTEVVGLHGDALKVRVTAPPEGGKANRAVAALLARTLALPPTSVELVAGASSRRKRFRVAGISSDELTQRLGTLF